MPSSHRQGTTSTYLRTSGVIPEITNSLWQSSESCTLSSILQLDQTAGHRKRQVCFGGRSCWTTWPPRRVWKVFPWKKYLHLSPVQSKFHLLAFQKQLRSCSLTALYLVLNTHIRQHVLSNSSSLRGLKIMKKWKISSENHWNVAKVLVMFEQCWTMHPQSASLKQLLSNNSITNVEC